MVSDQKLQVVLYWHMHQPEYRDLESHEFGQPWTYLHAIKDYTDMAAHLEANPAARAVINFTPILITQLEDYERQIAAVDRGGPPVRDPVLAALTEPGFATGGERRAALVQACLRAHPEHMMKRNPAYERLVGIGRVLLERHGADAYLTDQFMADLVTWYHLAWLGESVRSGNDTVRALMDQGEAFTLAQRHALLAVIKDLIAGLRGRYRRLAETGRVELTTSPYAHPILPLLLDFSSASEATPGISLPHLQRYPGGRERALAQLASGRQCFERYFGIVPTGCWPSEGAISDETLEVIAAAGFRWTATGAAVLRNSLAPSNHTCDLYRPYRAPGSRLTLFARDDTLSDLIGFTYAKWHSDDAVADLERRLCAIADDGGSHRRVVSIIMDGENAWEYYPANAHYFLSKLYSRLAEHPRLELTTYARVLDRIEPLPLDSVVAGSWVYGNLGTWIGDPDKNRAWDMLGEAKAAYDLAAATSGFAGTERAQKAHERLMVCEGSDWFWWLGEYNPAESVRDFEHLFRMHLANLYRAIGAPPPDYLSNIVGRGHGAPAQGGVMRPGHADGAR